MKILFIHQNFPGQFKHLAPALAAQGHQVVALATRAGHQLPGVKQLVYPICQSSSTQIHQLAADFETKLIRGQACAEAMLQLKQQGFVPDLVVAHPGWGEALFIKEIYPKTKTLFFLEFFYHAYGADTHFDQEFDQEDWLTDAKIRVKNACNLMSLQQMDFAYTPTAWQKCTFPELYHPQIKVIHDGIDTQYLLPQADAELNLQHQGQALRLSAGDEIITFVNRNLEPYRGYHKLMRALPEILRARPNARVLLVGGDQLSYGAPAHAGKSWKQVLLEEVGAQLDLSRVHFLGSLPYETYLQVLRISAVHIYLTYPFVLSWSMLEAMSMECLVVGSKTAPVTEVIQHGKNGLLVDFFNQDELVATTIAALANPGAYCELRRQARRHIAEHYDLRSRCLPAQLEMVKEILSY